ncbi:MAG TPA: nuclear transport factor 2 family protein [Steroidobacteraceae bacterium]|jgi:limonene-1,2-epoxide hydrolase
MRLPLPAIFGAALLALALPAVADTPDTDAQKLATVRQMIDAWNQRNWQQVYELFAPDGTLQSMMLPPTVGREAIQQRISTLAQGIEAIELRVRHIGIVDGVVFVERVDDFVYRGKHGAVPVVGVVEVEQGRVKAWREYYDRAQLLEAMGLKE